uniref:Dolichol-phosphate mannosyltransferase subunit 3 n=1 Tax=Echinococcus granulosus TaxID=6210 RepID=A0A068WBL5_ECHGR|nr:Dolichol phosphate mannosyltransferase subunit 3 [Echinococcus granulosus]
MVIKLHHGGLKLGLADRFSVATPPMVRAVRWITGVVLSIAVWLGVLYAPFSRSNALDLIILYSPVAIIVSFGLFSLFFIIYGVVTFNDCPSKTWSFHLFFVFCNIFLTYNPSMRQIRSGFSLGQFKDVLHPSPNFNENVPPTE